MHVYVATRVASVHLSSNRIYRTLLGSQDGHGTHILDAFQSQSPKNRVRLLCSEAAEVRPEGTEGPAKLAVTTHLYVAAVVATGGQLDPAEGDGALQGHLDGRLLNPVLAIGPRGARDGATAEVPLDWH